MKSYRIPKEEALSEGNIRKAFLQAAKHKSGRKDVAQILVNLDTEVPKLKKMLEDDTWEPKKHKPCTINETNYLKTRQIIKPDFCYEQVVHHVVVQAISGPIMSGMYGFVLGSIPGRGAHLGKRYIEKWMRADARNTRYCFKMDIRHFFQSIDHSLLKKWLARKFRDEWLLRLMYRIIDSVDEGLPLGFYTSQWFANFYLQPLDHYIKEVLHIKYYTRYMDDIVCFGANKKELHRCARAIMQYLSKELHLSTKRDWQVFRVEYTNKKGAIRGRALDYMGFVFHRDHTVMRRSIMLRLARRARKAGRRGKINHKDAAAVLASVGWIKATDTYGMYLTRVKPYVSIRRLKRMISTTQRRMNRDAELQIC